MVSVEHLLIGSARLLRTLLSASREKSQDNAQQGQSE
jgi:hypothetical protein